MSKITHSKYRNTGIIFEILIRQITRDSILNKESKAINIIKNYFNKTEIAKENKLYQTLLKNRNLSENKAESIINVILEVSRTLDKDKLNSEKHKLIKEIKNSYDLNDFFKTPLPEYRTLAAIYTLLENIKSVNPDTNVMISSKSNILEYITSENNTTTTILSELSTMESGERYLVYKIMLEKFNTKYDNLNKDQKETLKEYISNISDSEDLKESLDIKFKKLQESLKNKISIVEDKVLKVKIQEIINLIQPILEAKKMKEEYVISLLQYQELEKELNNI